MVYSAIFTLIAQRLEQWFYTPRVTGSNPVKGIVVSFQSRR